MDVVRLSLQNYHTTISRQRQAPGGTTTPPGVVIGHWSMAFDF